MKHGITLPLAFYNQRHCSKTPNLNLHCYETRILMIECIYKKKLQLLINKNILSVYQMIYYTYFTHALFQGFEEKKLLYLELFKPTSEILNLFEDSNDYYN